MTKLVGFASAFAVAFALGGVALADDDCCKGKKDEAAQKDDCCKGEKAAKKDECCKGEEAAKKTDACEGGKDSCGGEKACGMTLEAKPATFALKVSGMTCDGCAKGVTE